MNPYLRSGATHVNHKMQKSGITSSELSAINIDEKHIIKSKGTFVKQFMFNLTSSSKLYTDIIIGINRCNVPGLSISQLKNIILDIRYTNGVTVATIVYQMILINGIIDRAYSASSK